MARPVGALNRVTRQLKDELRLFLFGGEYQAALKKRIVAGEAPTIELYFWQMLCGKPREQIELTVGQQEDFSDLSIEELQQKMAEMMTQLQEAREVEDALPAEYRVQREATQVDTQTEATTANVDAVDPRPAGGAQNQDQERAAEGHGRPAQEPSEEHGEDGEVDRSSPEGHIPAGGETCSEPSSPTT